MKTRSRPRQSASTLVVVMIIMATLAVIVAVAADYTANIGRQVQRSNTLESAVTVGDSCMEILFANWRNRCRQNPSNTLPSASFLLPPIPLPTAAMFPSLSSLPGFSFGASRTDYYGSGTPNPPTISNFNVVAATPEWSPYPSASITAPKPIVGPAASDIATLTVTTPATFNYIASADVTLPTMKGSVIAKVRRVFQKQQQSPWNFAIFYEDPLEIHPGPPFTVTGWVHTNSDLYTAHDTLTFADKVTFGGNWNIDFMPGDEQHNGNTPAKPNYPSTLPPARDQSLQAFGIDPGLIDSTDTNPNNDSYHELIEPPVTGYTDPLASSRYYDAANIIITVDVSNNVTIGIGNGSGGSTSINPPSSGPDLRTSTQKNLYNMFNGAITTGGTIQDNREGAAIRVVKVDVSKLTWPKGGATNGVRWGTSGFDATNSFGVNPIVYVYDNSETSSARRGVELINGETLPGTGVSIASQNPVYLKGDFNTGRGTDADGDGLPDNGVETPSNVAGSYSDPANPPDPQVSGYTRVPSSIVADAVNILSNSWKDSLSGTTPNASPTTVNTAIVSGIVPTADAGGDGSYSGGAENFPRFLENWSSDTLSYYGSMVELYKSQQSTGEWGKANVYSPPVRKWFFDSNFKTKPPPGSIMIYSYIKGKWSLL